MRLIDADKLKQSVTNEMLKAEPNSEIYCTLECIVSDIESCPTAFDVDNIIEYFREQVKENAKAKSMARFEWLAAIEIIQKELEMGGLNE